MATKETKTPVKKDDLYTNATTPAGVTSHPSFGGTNVLKDGEAKWYLKTASDVKAKK